MQDSIDKTIMQIADDMFIDALLGQAASQTSNYAHYVDEKKLNCLLIAGGEPCNHGLNYEQSEGLFVHDVSYRGIRFTSATTKVVPFLNINELKTQEKKIKSKYN